VSVVVGMNNHSSLLFPLLPELATGHSALLTIWRTIKDPFATLYCGWTGGGYVFHDEFPL
jgi:hypothetical protein